MDEEYATSTWVPRSLSLVLALSRDHDSADSVRVCVLDFVVTEFSVHLNFIWHNCNLCLP